MPAVSDTSFDTVSVNAEISALIFSRLSVNLFGGHDAFSVAVAGYNAS